MCVCVVEVYISTVCSIHPLLTSAADSLQSSNVTKMDTFQTGKRQKRVHMQQNPASCSKKRAMSPQEAGMCVYTESQCDRECMCVGGRDRGFITNLKFMPSRVLYMPNMLPYTCTILQFTILYTGGACTTAATHHVAQ